MIKYIFILLLIPMAVSAQTTRLSAAHIFGSNMVIQQGINAPVWGLARPGEQITVSFAGTKTKTTAAPDGKWILKMPKQNYGGPFQMKIDVKDTSILFDNVMVGEVWLASGQSNMQFGLDHTINAKADIAAADYPNIRFFSVPNLTSPVPLNDVKSNQWRVCSPSVAGFFSGVGYFFAKNLYLSKNVPVGIIQSSWGGTFIEGWMSGQMLLSLPDYKAKYLALNKDTTAWNLKVSKSVKLDHERNEMVKTAQEGLKKGVNQIEFDDAGWRVTDYPMTMTKLGAPDYWGFMWFRKEFTAEQSAANAKLKIVLPVYGDDYLVYINGKEIGHYERTTTRSFEIPSAVVTPGKNIFAIRILTTYGTAKIGEKEFISPEINSADGSVHIPLSGAWKSNGSIEPKTPGLQDYFNTYTVLYNAMIHPLMPYGIKGVIWYQGENNVSKPIEYRTLFPAMINDWRAHWQEGDFPFLFVQLASMKKPAPNDIKLALLREAQANTLTLPNTGMATAVDVGLVDDIHPKDKRPVGERLVLAARKVAYHENVVNSGPIYYQMKISGDKINISFKSVGSGLRALVNSSLGGFKVAGVDSVFYKATANIISDHEVVVSAPKVQKPVAVRFDFESWPDGYLYNKEGLPAPPFRTDNWPIDLKKVIVTQ